MARVSWGVRGGSQSLGGMHKGWRGGTQRVFLFPLFHFPNRAKEREMEGKREKGGWWLASLLGNVDGIPRASSRGLKITLLPLAHLLCKDMAHLDLFLHRIDPFQLLCSYNE